MNPVSCCDPRVHPPAREGLSGSRRMQGLDKPHVGWAEWGTCPPTWLGVGGAQFPSVHACGAGAGDGRSDEVRTPSTEGGAAQQCSTG